jgi:hypothetical protein
MLQYFKNVAVIKALMYFSQSVECQDMKLTTQFWLALEVHGAVPRQPHTFSDTVFN